MLYRIQCSYIIISSVLNDDPMNPWRKYIRCRRRCRRHVLTMEEEEPQFCYQHRTLGLAAMVVLPETLTRRVCISEDGMDPSNPGNVNNKATPGGSNTGPLKWKRATVEAMGMEYQEPHPWPPWEAPDGGRARWEDQSRRPLSRRIRVFSPLQNAFREMVMDTLMMC